VVAAGQGEVPGGDTGPDRRGDGVGDGAVQAGQEVALLVGDGIPRWRASSSQVPWTWSTRLPPSPVSNASHISWHSTTGWMRETGFPLAFVTTRK
jgi:hypothetical protein